MKTTYGRDATDTEPDRVRAMPGGRLTGLEIIDTPEGGRMLVLFVANGDGKELAVPVSPANGLVLHDWLSMLVERFE